MTKREAIQHFLNTVAKPDMAALYSKEMEVQVNVLKANGEVIVGDFEGKRWRGFSDGIMTWKSFRIPFKAMSSPEYEDSNQTFPLEDYAEGIGMTGYDFENFRSKWVAFDFDAMVGHSDKHSKKLSAEELTELQKRVREIPWVELRSSTSGNGFHLYVFLEDKERVANHTEHAAVARAVLSQMSLILNYPLENKVDICGGNMWIWHRKMTDMGFKLLKKREMLCPFPSNWKAHTEVTTKRASKVKFENADLAGANNNIELNTEHNKLIDWLRNQPKAWWWDQDHRMLVCHTSTIKAASLAIPLKGVFDTLSTGSDATDHNCFLFPLGDGSWVVRRYGKGTAETASWTKDKNGFTRCFLNKLLDVKTLLKNYGAVEHPKGGWMVDDTKFFQDLGIVLPVEKRPVKVLPHKEGGKKIVLQIDGAQQESFKGWIHDRKIWTRVFEVSVEFDSDSDDSSDDFVRHVVDVNNKDAGWLIKSPEGKWINEPLNHVQKAIPNDSDEVVAKCIRNPWTLISHPFAPEYPGGRQWNKSSAQLKYEPLEGRDFPTWRKLYFQCGRGLNDDLPKNEWCQENGILNGADYLMCWTASVIKEPLKPLPYLFFWGVQDTGKSLFHEAFSCLFTGGYMTGKNAITNSSGFNGEIEHSVVVAIDELDLAQNKGALNIIKDWVTSPFLTIHIKGKTPYMIRNTTHWIHTANDSKYCPIFPGDTRITSIEVFPFEGEREAKDLLFKKLEEEAPYFINHLLNIELPNSRSRLNIPIIETQSKYEVAEHNTSSLELFIRDHCIQEAGWIIPYPLFYEKFMMSISDQHERLGWSRKRFSAELPDANKSGLVPKYHATFVSNLKFKQEEWMTRDCIRFANRVIKVRDQLVQELPHAQS